MTTEKNKVTATKTTAAAPAPKAAEDGTGVIALDPWLSPYKTALQERYSLPTLISRFCDALLPSHTYFQYRAFILFQWLGGNHGKC
jgi:hypothetical protein